MKHLKFLFIIISLAIFVSCSNSDGDGGIVGDGNKAIFSGVIGELQTRVTGNSWDSGDAIGIYAIKSDQALSAAAIHDGKSNVKYTTNGDGNFTPETDVINFPNNGNLDFVAYYPFQIMPIDFVYSIDATTQSSPADIDLLYSNNAKRGNKSNPNVNLHFKHMLSKLIFYITLGEDMSLSNGFDVSMKDVVVDGLFSLIDGKVAVGKTRKNLDPIVSIAKDNKSATVTAIVVPDQNLKDATIVFTHDGKDYEWTPSSQELVSSTKYSYSLKLIIDDSGLPTVVPVKIGATIDDWVEGNTGGGEIILTPNGDSETPEPGVFVVDKSEISLEANTGLNNTIKLTAETTQQWTSESNVTWLTVAPASGTGNANIVATAEENTSETDRSSKVTITPTGDDSLSPIIINITQKGKTTSSGEPDGSKNNPYTFAEARDNQGVKDNTDYVWVKGFIVGTSNSGGDFVPIFSTSNASGTNILIADNKDETNGSSLVAVQLAYGGTARTDLNLVNNSGMYKAEVKLYGTLEAYFGTTGLKNVKEYELITTGEGGTTPDPDPDPTGYIMFEALAGTLGTFIEYSVEGESTWYGDEFNADKYAKISGFDGATNTANPNEDWLISPAINLSEVSNAELTFSHLVGHATGKESTELTVWVSSNYSSGNPNSATWNQITVTYPPKHPTSNFSDWHNVAVSIPSSMIGKNGVRVAFKYICGNSGAMTWEVMKVGVK